MAPWIIVLSQHTVFTKRMIYYKFTFVWYSVKHGTMHRPTSLMAHCVPFLWLWEERRQQRSWVGDFPGHCLLWWLLLRLAAAAIVVPPFLLLPQNSLQHHWPLYWILGWCQQPEFHWWLPPRFLFFPSHCSTATMVCLIEIPFCDGAQLQKPYAMKIWAAFTVTVKQI